MSTKTLSIIETAYRATLEEQDDPILWMTHAMKGAGGDFTVLLRGNAVNYAVKSQKAEKLAFGAWEQTHPADLARDVKGLIDKGVATYVVEEDVGERGLERSELVEGIQTVSRGGIAKLVSSHNRVWHW